MRQRASSAFSFFTGDERRYRGHYHLQGVQAVAAPRRQPAKPKPKQLESAIRKKRLDVLCELAATFKQSRSERVTAKGRERSGTLPAFAYGPSAVPPPTASERERPKHGPKLSSGRQTDAGGASSSGSSGASAGTAEVLYRAGDVVFVQPVSGGMWVAQLTEPVVRTMGLTVRSPSAPTAPLLATSSGRRSCRATRTPCNSGRLAASASVAASPMVRLLCSWLIAATGCTSHLRSQTA